MATEGYKRKLNRVGEQIHKRLSKEFVEEVLEAFNDHWIGEEKACEMLGVRTAQLYKLRKRWLRSVIGNKPFELYGRVLAYYVDQHSIFRFVEHHGVHVRYALGVDEGEIQFRRALRSLDIGLIYARKGAAAAKGKVEKAFGYLQRRVPYLCERYRIRGVTEAQKIVEEVVSFYNEQRQHEETREVPLKRWKQALEAGKGRLRPLDPSADLDLGFSFH